MKNPLPLFVLRSPYKERKRQEVEALIEKDIYYSPLFHCDNNFLEWQSVYAAVDQMATAYARYRFSEIDKEALDKRFQEIVWDGNATTALNITKKNMQFEAAAIVDRAIDEVCFGAKRTGIFTQCKYRREKPFAESVLEDFQPHVMARLVRDCKESTVKELGRHRALREDKDTPETRKMFKELEKYAGHYIDYRLDLPNAPQRIQSVYTQTVSTFEEVGIGEHVGAQFLKKTEELAEANMKKFMGPRR